MAPRRRRSSLDFSAVSWGGKTYEEIGEIARTDRSILLVPVGSLEQHGRHLPTATDTILVDAVATAGAERVADDVPVLVTPPVWTGHSPHHLSFGGTVSVPAAELLGLLRRTAATALENGFDSILFLNGHGGNMAPLGSAVSEIGARHPDRQVLGLTYFHLARPFVDEIRESETGGISHAGEMETSLMLHLRPELVREDAVEGTPRDEPYERGRHDLFDDGPLTVYRPFEAYSESGAIGSPELASAEKGKRLFEGLEAELSELLEEIHRYGK